MRTTEAAWRELVDRLLDAAEERPDGYKQMFFHGEVGFSGPYCKSNH